MKTRTKHGSNFDFSIYLVLDHHKIRIAPYLVKNESQLDMYFSDFAQCYIIASSVYDYGHGAYASIRNHMITLKNGQFLMSAYTRMWSNKVRAIEFPLLRVLVILCSSHATLNLMNIYGEI